MKSFLGHLVLAVILAVIFLTVLDGMGINPFGLTDVLAMGNGTGKHNGCHTYNVYGHQDRGINGIDSVFCGNVKAPAKKENTRVSDVAPTVAPIVTESPIVEVIPTQEPTVAPTNTPEAAPIVTVEPTVNTPEEGKRHCNNGEGNGGEGCSPAQSENANNDENNTRPNEDRHSSLISLLSGFIFVSFKVGKEKYGVHVSSWDYSRKGYLTLCTYSDDDGNGGFWGVIKGAKVIMSCVSAVGKHYVSQDVKDLCIELHDATEGEN